MVESKTRPEKLGITVRKEEDFSEWFTQVVLKAELADYSSGKGFIVIRPNGYEIWDNIKNFFDAEIKKTGHRNAYFPTLIPESLLKKEAEHFTGFVPEVFWVTKSGNNELSEYFAVRPTSETVIHDAMKNWVHSWRDLPLLLNVWNSVLRAEIKSTKPFIRTSEFLWQEGHTAHSSEQEAENEVMQILSLYKRLLEELLAIPALNGKKSEKEKFVGALYTTTLESMMPDGRALQMATSHQLGQNFSKPFEIRFLGEDGEMHFVWHTSWGISWRTIGALIMVHGDDKGLVIPPRVAPTQVIIVPILFSESIRGNDVLSKCNQIQSDLHSAGIRVSIDLRENYTPGWKFNEWELKGIPLRMEVGPRDLSKNSVVLVRRDTGKKEAVPMENLSQIVKDQLAKIQDSLWEKANELLKTKTRDASTFQELSDILEKQGGFVRSFWCGSRDCEDKIKDKTGGDIRVIPFEQPLDLSSKKCIFCNSQAKFLVYFAKAY
ncbi:MAG: proline--tRNA ligase [archaeon]|nr:proline--tRNA ligase [archaeon]